MTAPDARTDPRAAARLYAQTSKLLGVDFVPVYRRGEETRELPADENLMFGRGDVLRRAGPASHDARDGGAEPEAARATPSPQPPVRADTAPSVLSGRDAGPVRRRLAAIRARYEKDAPHNAFNTTFNQIVFDDGDPTSRLMFVGEAPGADEDRIGRPFVGRAGQLLDKMIVAMGLRRQDVYIANVLKTRPPNNATPTLDECALCLPYLHEQIEAVRPEVIVTLGLTATRALLQTEASMSQMRGRWTAWIHPDEVRFPGLTIPVMPTFHPAFLLRQYTPENRSKVWSDLREVLKRLGLPTKAGGKAGS